MPGDSNFDGEHAAGGLDLLQQRVMVVQEEVQELVLMPHRTL